jgi:hypothetical protein
MEGVSKDANNAVEAAKEEATKATEAVTEKVEVMRAKKPSLTPPVPVVPFASASDSAARTGARSAAVINLSQPQPIEKLHIAPGY